MTVERPVSPALFVHPTEPIPPVVGATKAEWRGYVIDLLSWGRGLAVTLDGAKAALTP